MNKIERLCEMKGAACLIVDANQIERHPNCQFEKVIELCKKIGILVVLDEMKTAGQVTSYGYFKEKYSFDFTVLGKEIGNGIPVSLLLGHKKYKSDLYDVVKLAGTYTRDLLSCEAVLATEEIMTATKGYIK